MPKQVFKSELFCLQCNKESIHKIEYQERHITRICCVECGTTIGPYRNVPVNPLPRHLTYRTTLTTAQMLKRACPSRTKAPEMPPVLSLQHYGESLLSRIITKPSRLNQEFHKDLNTFLHSLPVRLITKPMRIAKELEQHISKETGQKPPQKPLK